MKLIEFLLNNWYIAIVVFFLASSFLKRLKGVPGSQPPKQAMPPFGGGGNPMQGWGRDKAPEVTTANQPNQRKNRPQTATESAQRRPDSYVHPEHVHHSSEKRPEADFWGDSDLSSARQDERTKQKRSEEQKYREDAVDAHKLAQGVIWAEILGPPRAKKPFRK
ncbi:MULTISPECIES: hypothetical protein [unclassified Paenibacillus]|uniref:hypothetical protein n=1 Tax=unclassified Paenibacillus TaxID=185978 RepID=UPI003627F1A3